MPWFYLSFASADAFLGACIVEAADAVDAPLVAHARGCNPGGEVLILPTPGDVPGPLEPYKLLSKAELGEGEETLGELQDRGAIPREEVTITDPRVAREIPPSHSVVMREGSNPTREEWAQRFARIAAENIEERRREAWWATYNRAAVLASIEDATGTALSANDPLPDSLIANAQALGLIPAELRMWIHDEPKRGDWSLAALRAWAARYELGIAGAEQTAKDEGFIT